jgi:hypothetical protein
MRQDDDLRLYQGEQRCAPVNMLQVAAMPLLLPLWRARRTAGNEARKMHDTPCGANCIISGSTVGFPGGTKKPSRARHPIIPGSSRMDENDR